MTMAGFFVSMTFTVLIPTLPLFAVRTLHIADSRIGLLLGLFTFSVFIARLPVDHLSRRTGPHRLLVASTPLLTVTALSHLFASSFAGLLVLRIAHGLLYGVITTVMTALAALSVEKSKRGSAIGTYNAFQAFSMAIGPALGELLLSFGAGCLFASCAFFALCSTVLSVIIRNRMPAIETASVDSSSGFASRWVETKAIPPALMMLLFAVVFGCVLSYLSIFAQERQLFGWTGLFFACYAAGIFAVRPLLGRLIDGGRSRLAVRIGAAVMTISMILFFASHAPFVFLSSGFLLGAGYGMCLTALQHVAISRVAPQRYPAATGTFFWSLDIGFSFGSVAFGALLVWFSLATLFMGLAIVPALALLIMLWIPPCRRKRRESDEA